MSARQNGGVDSPETRLLTETPDRPELTNEEAAPRRPSRWRSRLASVELLAAVVLLAVLLRGSLVDLFSSPKAATFLTIFGSVVVAGLPFLVLSAAASAALRAFVPYGLLDRLLKLRKEAALPASVAAGLAAPLGDDGVDATVGLMRASPAGHESSGHAAKTVQAVAITFLLASAAINPVVLVATVVAFPDEPMMVLARLLAALIAAAALGWLWIGLGKAEWLTLHRPDAEQPPDGAGGWPVFWERCRLDVVRAGGFLVLGAFVAAVLTGWLPPRWLDTIADTGLFAVVAMALLAVLLSVRGGLDAFVAAAVSQFSATARLAFLVVGPMANLRLFTRQVAVFGPRFAVRFASAALIVGLVCALLVGAVRL